MSSSRPAAQPRWPGSFAHVPRAETSTWWVARRRYGAFLEIGELDRLEIVVLPVLLGDGIPLSPAGAPAVPLRLVRADRTFADGSAELVYAPAAAAG